MKKICIIKLGALGDVVRTLPILLGIKEKFKEGLCQECGNHGLIYKIDGNWICEGCKTDL